MDPDEPVNTAEAVSQWERLRDRLRGLGHTVEELPARPGLPDMVFSANGATVIDGRVLGARFSYRSRAPETAAHRAWFLSHGVAFHEPEHTNEGEGDYAVTASHLLAGYGFRTPWPHMPRRRNSSAAPCSASNSSTPAITTSTRP